jgi:hypothetical protein
LAIAKKVREEGAPAVQTALHRLDYLEEEVRILGAQKVRIRDRRRTILCTQSMTGQLFRCPHFYPQLLFPPLTINNF